MALKYFQKLMTETNWYDKICSYCSHCQEIPRVWGAVNQEPWMKKNI